MCLCGGGGERVSVVVEAVALLADTAARPCITTTNRSPHCTTATGRAVTPHYYRHQLAGPSRTGGSRTVATLLPWPASSRSTPVCWFNSKVSTPDTQTSSLTASARRTIGQDRRSSSANRETVFVSRVRGYET